MAKFSNIGSQKQRSLNTKIGKDEQRRAVLQKLADDAAANAETEAEAAKIVQFQKDQRRKAEEAGAITGQYPDLSPYVTGEAILPGKRRNTEATAGNISQFIGYDDNGDIIISPRDSTQAQQNMDYRTNQMQQLGATIRPPDYNLKGLDPELIRRMGAMGLSPGLGADGTGTGTYDEEGDMYAAYPQLSQFAEGMALPADEQKGYIEGLIAEGYLPVSEVGGIPRKLQKRQSVSGELNEEDQNTYDLVYKHYLERTGSETIATNRANYWRNKQKQESESFPAFMDRGQYIPLTAQEATTVVSDLYGNANKLQNMLMNFAASNPRVAQTFDKWVGEPNAMHSPQLNLALLLAYYRAMEEASWADFSDEEKVTHEKYAQVKGERHPNLWRRDRNRNARTPQRKVLEESIGDYIEEVTRTNFGSTQSKSQIGQLLLEAVAQTDFEAHDIWAGAPAPAGMSLTTNKVERYIEKGKDQKMYKVEGYSTDRALSRFLADSKGIRDLLQPNFRNHVRVNEIKQERGLDEEVQGSKVSGISPIRTNEQNITENMGMQLDPAMINIFDQLYNNKDWHEYWNHNVKFKPQHWHIISQENAWIIQNAKDNKTFYLDSKYRNSGRKGTQRLLMADMKPMRAMTISATHSDNIILSKKGKKRTAEEDLLMVSLSMMLGYDDKVFSYMERGMKDLFEGKNARAKEARAIGRYFNELGEQKQPSDPTMNAKRLDDSGFIVEGLDSIQALRTLDSYLSAKENGQNVFQTKFITAVDAAQSGQSIQAFQMGDILTAMRGGLNTPDWMPRSTKARKAGNRLDLEKLYEATVGNTRQILDGQTQEDAGLDKFIRIIFGAPEGGAISAQGGVWAQAKAFAKRAVQGASYGQGQEGAILSVMEELTEWTEDNWTAQEATDRIAALEAEFGFYNKKDLKDGKARERVVSINENGGISFRGEAQKQLRKYADAFVIGMNKADPDILKYSQEMRNVFKTYVKLADFASQQGIAFDAPQFTYNEPAGTAYHQMYGGTPYVPGLRTSMLDKVIPEEWATMTMGELMDANGNPIQVFYEKGQSKPDLQTEVDAMARDAEEQSTGVTRFPVITIHGLDDLILSMAVTELKKMSAAEASKTGKPDAFQFYLSVWDSGRISPLMIQKFTDAYNKAFLKVMQENRFFKMLLNQFETYLGKAEVRKAMGTIKLDKNHPLYSDVTDIEGKIDRLRTLIAKIESGGKKGITSPTRDSKTLKGQNTLNDWAEQLGWNNTYIPSKDSQKAKAKAMKKGRDDYVPVEPGLRSTEELMDEDTVVEDIKDSELSDEAKKDLFKSLQNLF